MSTTPSTKLWGGRFSSETKTETQDFTQSVDADSRLVAYDIWGSQAHAIMLARGKIISDEDLRQILIWLRRAEEDYDNHTFVLKPEKEDVHMNVESYLIDGAGIEYGGKLHTARSRNDQVLVDAHLYIREQILGTQTGLSELCRAFLRIASNHAENGDAGLHAYAACPANQSRVLGNRVCQYVTPRPEAVGFRLRPRQHESVGRLCNCWHVFRD